MNNEGLILGKNATLVCLGDSITEAPGGYVSVMRNLLSAGYPERNITVINAGVSGNRAPDMLARLQRDVIDRRPTCVTIHVGINDVWHGFQGGDPPREYPAGDGPNGTPLDEYEATVARIVDTLREATDADIVLATPTVIGEDVDNPDNVANALLAGYVAAMLRVAEWRSTFIAPLHDAFCLSIRAGVRANPNFRLTSDGVHMTPVGDHLMALTLLSTLGFGGL